MKYKDNAVRNNVSIYKELERVAQLITDPPPTSLTTLSGEKMKQIVTCDT